MAFDRAAFGAASSCNSLDEVAQFIGARPASRRARREAAAFGMFLVAIEGAKSNSHFEDALAALDRLAFAKATLDSAAHHTTSEVEITSSILSAAQQFVDQMAVPCTEWPTTEEFAASVYDNARSLVNP